MMIPVHRLVTEAEKQKYPGAYTYQERTGTYHNKQGYVVGRKEKP